VPIVWNAATAVSMAALLDAAVAYPEMDTMKSKPASNTPSSNFLNLCKKSIKQLLSKLVIINANSNDNDYH
jgi:hypothetical protein